MSQSANLKVLSPAGSFASLQSAINAGCHAIYFGTEQLNMRTRSSDNFALEQIKEVAALCHEKNVEAYLAVNTLLYDFDISLLQKILTLAKNADIDAVILADTAAIQAAKSLGLKIHISTQLSISNYESVAFWSSFADVIVLARELTLPMIRTITEQIQKNDLRGPSGELVKIEVFAHGAMCVAISGRCGMSLYGYNASANRGACLQNCRKPYIVTDKETGLELEIDNEYVMSPKDISTIDFLDQVADAGVSVLKLEGRGRAPDYVDVVTKCYREAVDALAENSYSKEKVEKWQHQLMKVYNRGLSDGYYLGKKQGEWSEIPNSQATQEKVFVGKVEHYYPKAGVMQINVQAAELEMNAEIIVSGETTGLIRDTVSKIISEDDEEIAIAQKKTLVTLKIAEKVRRNDKVFFLRERKPLTYGKK